MNAHTTSSGHRKYYRVSLEDNDWLDKQTEGVRKLWRELATADPYGTKEGVPFTTSLKNTAFFTAKKKIEEYGAFKIFSVPSQNDGRVKEWRVFNRHGSSNRHYWGDNAALASLASYTQADYHKFLRSDYWKAVREQIIRRDNNCCQQCGTQYQLQVHHLTYEHHGYEHEYLEDLITLCRGCHEEVHSVT